MERPLEDPASGDRVAAVAALRRALDREAHVLSHRPDLLWQQLFNRLQWVGGPVSSLVGPEFEQRSRPGASPWLRTRTRFRESETLARTFEGHGWWVTACAFSPDGTRVVSGSWDKTLKVWDSRSGRVLSTFEGHGEPVHACAFSPDGSQVISAAEDRALKLWDAETGREVLTYEDHHGPVLTCARRPDGTQLISGSSDKTLRIWEVQTGPVLHVLEGHGG
ncbi:MAG: WD40 repeat domain-containing protein, partial [Longimicrobiales bacterium]